MRRKVPLLRGLAILMVVLAHAALRGLMPLAPPPGVELALPTGEAVQYHLLFAVVQASYFAVPAFFFVTGLFSTFALQKPGFGANWDFTRGRLKALLVPLAIWSVVAVVLDWRLGVTDWSEFAWAHLQAGEIEWGYYFLLAMVQLYLVAPALMAACRSAPARVLSLAIAVHLGVLALRGLGAFAGVLDYPGLGARLGDFALWRWFLYVALGCLAGLRGSVVEGWLKARGRRLRWLAALALGLCVAEGLGLTLGLRAPEWLPCQQRPFVTLFALAALAAYFATDIAQSRLTRLLEKLGGMSFGIFLLHPLAYRVLERVFHNHFDQDTQMTYAWAFALLYFLLGACLPAVAIDRLSKTRWRKQVALILGH